MGHAQAGLLSREKQKTGVPTLCQRWKATPLAALCASCQADPARSENHGMCGTFVRENREVPCLPVRVVRGRPRGNAEAVIPGWTGAGSRISSVVPASLPNEVRAEEAGEERN